MNKGLDALQKLELDDCYTIEEFNECYSTIKKELKEYEKLKEDIKKCSCWNEHKTLELIKSKIKIKLDYSISGTQGTHYFIETQEDIIPITKEEYDLLKEVFYD